MSAGVPADRLKVLREALQKTVTDPAFQADATRPRSMVYIGPEAVAKGFDALMQQRPEVLKEMEKYIKFGG